VKISLLYWSIPALPSYSGVLASDRIAVVYLIPEHGLLDKVTSRLGCFLCTSELISAKEDAEVLRLPIPISATSTYRPTLHYYCEVTASDVTAEIDFIPVSLQIPICKSLDRSKQ